MNTNTNDENLKKADNDTIAITATQAAISHFKKQLVKQGLPENALGSVRLNIVKAGCSGYRYEVTLINDQNPITDQDKMFKLDDNLSLYVSRKVFPSVMGTCIDYQKKGLSGELVYENPQQTGACGCGESFTIE